jgi:hypothetical protein
MPLSPEDQKTADAVLDAIHAHGISTVQTPNDIPDVESDDPPELFRQQAILFLAVCAAYSISPVVLGRSLVEAAKYDPETYKIIAYVRDALGEV